jgi:hypothetical protein
MTAFADALDLKTAVGDHIGNRSISDVWPRLVQMAETDLNTRLRSREQLVVDTLYFDSGISTLPPDFLEIASFPDSRGRDTYPRYSVDGFFITIQGYTGDKTVRYYAALPTLSCSLSACNWLLSKFPTVYLYGVGLQAAKYLKDVDLAQATDQLYGFALQTLKSSDERARWANQVVRVQGCTP